MPPRRNNKRRSPVAGINRPSKPKPGGPVVRNPTPFTGNSATQAAVPFGWVLFWPPGYPAHAVLVPMGEQGFVYEHTSGWESVTRPFGAALPAWQGMPVVEASVDVILERFQTQESVEPAWELLRGLGNRGSKPVTGIGKTPPPIMVVCGAKDSQPTTPKKEPIRWVITSIEKDDSATIRNERDNAIRIEATVNLMQFNQSATLQSSAAAIRKATPKPRTKTYKAKTGDTAISIAGKELHDRGRWPEILKANPSIRDPRAKIKAGTKVKLP